MRKRFCELVNLDGRLYKGPVYGFGWFDYEKYFESRARLYSAREIQPIDPITASKSSIQVYEGILHVNAQAE